MQFRNVSPERVAIDSIRSRLTGDENDLRMLLLARTIERGEPVNVGDLIGAGVLPPKARSLSEGLVGKRVIVQDQEGNLNFIYPVSALATRHRVSLEDGRRCFAMCAVDAMGTAFTFEQDVEIQSECSECGKPISVRIERGRLAEVAPPDLRVLHVDLNKFENWAAAA
jgi:hypothetical protein